MTLRSIIFAKQLSKWIGFWIISVAMLFIYFLNLPLWLDQSNDTSWAPISYSLIPVTAVVFGLVYHRNLGEFLKTPFFWWCSTLIIISGANFLRLTHLDYPLSDTAVALDQVQRFLLLPSYAFLIFLSPSRNLKLLIPLLALIAPSIIIMEFFFPEFFVNDKNNPDKVRIQGFWGNPNAAGEAVLLSLALASTRTTPKLLSIITTLCIVALIFTGSRAGMVMGGVMIVLLLINGRLPKLYSIIPMALIFSISTLTLQVEELAENIGRNQGIEDLTNRLSYFSDDIDEDFSEVARTDSALFGLQAALEKPILGHGVHYRDPIYGVGPHNLVVELFHDYGISGLLLWISLAIILFRSLDTRSITFKVGFLLFTWFSMFNHNLLEYQWWYIFLGITIYQSGKDVTYDLRIQPEYHPKSRKRRRRKRRRRFSSSKA